MEMTIPFLMILTIANKLRVKMQMVDNPIQWADRSKISFGWKRPVEKEYSRFHLDFIFTNGKYYVRPIRHWPLWVMLAQKYNN